MAGVADMLVCEKHVCMFENMLSTFDISEGFQRSKEMLNYACAFENRALTDNCFRESFVRKLKMKSIEWLAGYFCPLEVNINRHEHFLDLEYDHLQCLLDSGLPLALSENSLLTFIIEWLGKDQGNRCVDAYFEKVLKTIRGSMLSADFLAGHILKNSILNRWNGFVGWYEAVVNATISDTDCVLPPPGRESRNYTDPGNNISFDGWRAGTSKPFGEYRSRKFTVRKEHNKNEKYCLPSDLLIVEDGVKIQPYFLYSVTRSRQYDSPGELCLANNAEKDLACIISIADVPVFFKTPDSMYNHRNNHSSYEPEKQLNHRVEMQVFVCRASNFNNPPYQVSKVLM